jgi:peroxiredoxin
VRALSRALVEVSKRKWDWAKLDTEVLAVSSATPEKNAASSKLGELPFRLLSDSAFMEKIEGN